MPAAEAARRGAALLRLGLALASLAGCTPPASAPPPHAAAAPAGAGAVCRVGPDGGPPPDTVPPRLAERGIGGTGIGTAVAEGDRGIGGTGAPAIRQAERGIGGTGIVAVITGFASLCLGGQEVALAADLPVQIDGAAAGPGDLRAGQVALVEAAGPERALRALGIRIRHEVSGPVEAIGPDGLLRVAGQRVAVTPSTLGLTAPRPGQWVAVSGLPRPDGVVQATRLDPRRPGLVTVHGPLARTEKGWRVGVLPVQPAASGAAPGPAPGLAVITGRYAGGALREARIAPDPLGTDPAALFPPGTGRILFEGIASLDGGRLRLGPGLALAAPAGPWAGRAILALERMATGEMRATGLRPSGPGAEARPGPGGDAAARPGPNPMRPAPVPNRPAGLDAPAGGREAWEGGRGLVPAPGGDRAGMAWPDPGGPGGAAGGGSGGAMGGGGRGR
ncbi:DUF5666 domain-containing protein [Roseicella frigidaeris]|uniref:DUF5666 domain-containing protein n=1 Tax=Roseicella frigidaeris TaxID=2230885 RepID=A0A327M9P9_9PROT|nr:DUF5666 domain-containing protein [Roseicella frigidaeris]RAI59499.1 hypothetical protein DOO78_07810 [Roseicella frigidaeris]